MTRRTEQSEHCLRPAEVAARLGISPRQFRRLRTDLQASGLQVVQLRSESRPRYRAASLDLLIRRAAEREAAIVKG